MDNNDLSLQFDTLYNNIMSNAAPGLDNVDKSYIFTKAEYEVLLNHLNPAGNQYRQGIDDSSKRQTDFRKLIETKKIECTTPERDILDSEDAAFVEPELYSAFTTTLPTNILHILNESAVLYLYKGVKDDKAIYEALNRVVVPVAYDEYTRLLQRPYNRPLKRQMWRLLDNHYHTESEETEGEETPEETIVQDWSAYLIPTLSDESLLKGGEVAANNKLYYIIRYVRRPLPIIFEDGLTIDNVEGPCECELDDTLKQEIIQRAVEIAKAAYESGVTGAQQFQNMVLLGKRSE